MTSIRVIKKYPNRRLYDTEISSYITIEDVRQLIVDGEEFEVRDAKSGEDLTRQVLLQIIAEHEQDGEPMLSTQLLSQIIRFYGDSLQGFMGNYLERSMQIFLDQQQQFRHADGRPDRADAVDDDEPADRAQPGDVEGIPAATWSAEHRPTSRSKPTDTASAQGRRESWESARVAAQPSQR